MAIFKSVDLGHSRAKVSNDTLISNEVHYFLRPSKIIHNYWGGCNLVLGSVDAIIAQFRAPHRVYYKTDCIMVRHFIISFEHENERNQITARQAYRIAQLIAQIFINERQILFAVHEDTEHLHIHFLMSTINLNDGSIIGSYSYALQCYIEAEILKKPDLWGGTKSLFLTSVS